MTGIERLRKLSEDIGYKSLWSALMYGREDDWDCKEYDGKTLDGTLTAIADQIERESDVETVRSDAMRAWEWVREHGGVDELTRMFQDADNRRVELCGALGIDLDKGWSEAMAAMRLRLMPEGCDWEFLKLHMSNLRGFMLDVMDRLGVDKSDSDAPEIAFDVLDRRIMPEGMEWPRYESGEPVRIGDDFMGKDGKTYTAKQVQFIGKCFSLYDFCDRKPQFSGFYGEPVRRPAVPAGDGEPLEVGQTVYNVEDGTEYKVCKMGLPRVIVEYWCEGIAAHSSIIPSLLTHKRPVLDADGNRIEPAMDVWWVCEGDGRGVHAEKLHVESIGEDGLVTCDPFNGGTWVELEPSELYVKKPALDADGVLCREGDEVWEVRSHRRREIVGTHYLDYETGEPLILCDGDDAIPIPATCVTHAKPEPSDSWESIEEDARGLDSGVDRELFTHTHEDIVSRCRALAERERGE